MKQTIALVDDDRNILTSVTMTLEQEGFQVRTYTDGESALQGLAARPVDLAVLDIKMPRMDGMELLQRHGKRRGAPVFGDWLRTGWELVFPARCPDHRRPGDRRLLSPRPYLYCRDFTGPASRQNGRFFSTECRCRHSAGLSLELPGFAATPGRD